MLDFSNAAQNRYQYQFSSNSAERIAHYEETRINSSLLSKDYVAEHPEMDFKNVYVGIRTADDAYFIHMCADGNAELTEEQMAYLKETYGSLDGLAQEDYQRLLADLVNFNVLASQIVHQEFGIGAMKANHSLFATDTERLSFDRLLALLHTRAAQTRGDLQSSGKTGDPLAYRYYENVLSMYEKLSALLAELAA